MRRGRKKYARFDLVVADSRSPRDGKFIEKIGLINPNAETIELNEERALYWVLTGATPTDTARTYLSENGIMLKKHLQIGVNKGAITQEQADKKFQEWKDKKFKTVESAAAVATQKKADERKAKLAAETKVNEARKAAIAAKAKPAEEAPAEEAPAAEGAAE
jgi:small subunit ribosomal protein S16